MKWSAIPDDVWQPLDNERFQSAVGVSHDKYWTAVQKLRIPEGATTPPKFAVVTETMDEAYNGRRLLLVSFEADGQRWDWGDYLD